jgi:hypothetical protein
MPPVKVKLETAPDILPREVAVFRAKTVKEVVLIVNCEPIVKAVPGVMSRIALQSVPESRLMRTPTEALFTTPAFGLLDWRAVPENEMAALA